MRNRHIPVMLLLTVGAQTISPAPVFAERPAAAATVEDARAANPIYLWAVRRGAFAVLGWVTGQVVDWAADRAGVTRAIETALDDLAGISNDPDVPASVKIELRTIQRDFRSYRDILARNNLSDAQTRVELRNLRNNFAAYVRATNARLAQLDARISQVEREQRRHVKMITDLEGRVVSLGSRLVDAEGRITDMEGRIVRLEQRVDDHDAILHPDPHRFLRHEAYLAGALLYANSPAVGEDAAVGGEITAQYNFNEYFGVFAGVAYMPMTASDVDSVSDGTSVTWDNLNVHLGATASVLEPRSPVSLQLGAGGGITSSRLLFYGDGVERTSENAEQLGQSSNVYILVKAEIGVAPPAYTFEPIATIGYMAFMDDVAYTGNEVSSNLGRSVWFVSLGVRFRQYLRDRDRRDVPAGLSGR